MVARARVTVRASAKDVPAYTTEPDAHALQSDSIVAPAADLNNPTPPHDIYHAQSRPSAHVACKRYSGPYPSRLEGCRWKRAAACGG